jgi:hypothetical protein
VRWRRADPRRRAGQRDPPSRRPEGAVQRRRERASPSDPAAKADSRHRRLEGPVRWRRVGLSRPAKPAPPAAGETSAAVADAVRQASGGSGSRSGFKIPRLISPIQGGYLENFQALPGVLDDCIPQGPGDGSGQVLLQCPDGGRVSAVRQSGQGVQRCTLQTPEEAREAAEVIKRTAKPTLQILS